MIRLVLLTLLCSSCSMTTPAPGSSFAMEELVLIEFAARLEEDYHRLHPGQSSAPISANEGKSISPPPTDVGSDEAHEPVREPVQYDHGQ